MMQQTIGVATFSPAADHTPVGIEPQRRAHHRARILFGYVLHLQVDDPKAWWQRAVDAGCTVTMPLDVQFWGDRYGQVKDPFDIVWSIGGKP